MYDPTIVFQKLSLWGFFVWLVSPFTRRHIVRERYAIAQTTVDVFQKYVCPTSPSQPEDIVDYHTGRDQARQRFALTVENMGPLKYSDSILAR
jgi:hypothetical protein